jgi:hypothetical protein
MLGRTALSIMPILLCLVLAAGCRSAYAAPLTLTRPWTVEYSVSGGVHGIRKHLIVHDDGRLLAEGRLKADLQALPSQLAALLEILGKAEFSLRSKTPLREEPVVPDMIYQSLTISTGGREYSVWANGLESLLDSIFEDSMKRADDERWARAGPFKLGRTWKVKEEVRENFMWRASWIGVWTRRGDSKLFDAIWRHDKTGEERRGTVELDAADRGELKLHCDATGARYQAPYSPEDQTRIVGSTSACRGCTWRATIEP